MTFRVPAASVPLTVTCPICGAPVAVLSCRKIKFHTAPPVRSNALLPKSVIVEIEARCNGTGAIVTRVE